MNNDHLKNNDKLENVTGLSEELLTVEIPTEIQAGLSLPPCVYRQSGGVLVA